MAGLWDDLCNGFLTTNGQYVWFLDNIYNICKYIYVYIYIRIYIYIYARQISQILHELSKIFIFSSTDGSQHDQQVHITSWVQGPSRMSRIHRESKCFLASIGLCITRPPCHFDVFGVQKPTVKATALRDSSTSSTFNLPFKIALIRSYKVQESSILGT